MMLKKFIYFLLAVLVLFGYQSIEAFNNESRDNAALHADDSGNRIDRFADLQILQYQVPGFENLTLKQKKLVYYLSMAALSGRDIIYAQNYRHNIQIRRFLETIYEHYEGDRNTEDWKAFEVYLKRVWFSNGIHHHYGEKKFYPGCPEPYMRSLFTSLMVMEKEIEWPTLEHENIMLMADKLLVIMYDPNTDVKKVNKNESADQVLESANNYYGPDVTAAEAHAFYEAMAVEGDTTPVSYGLNSRLIKENGELKEQVYKIGGRFSSAIYEMVSWLKKASEVAENDNQKKYLDLLIRYYETGDLKVWDECNIQWVKTQGGDIDLIHGFIENYGDAIGYKASYESVVQIKDFDASARMAKLSANAQWFEDNSPIMTAHKKASVVGVTYNVVNVAMEAGDCAPTTPIGINLPNARWIRANYGSKSVSLGNIVQAYNDASGEGTVDEFYLGDDVRARIRAHSELAGKMHTAMHEVIGHASGKLNKGVKSEDLKNYSSTLEEARADLVALYYTLDPKLVEWGLIPSLDVGKAEYDQYITNGMMVQLRRLESGDNIEEDHMRNRQLVAAWVFEKGKSENVIEKKTVNGKTYFVVNDYNKLRTLFGDLLREIQRIISEGDFDAGKALVEKYGVIADQDLIKEVKKRYEKFDLAPYSGFIQPEIIAVKNDQGEITDVKIEYKQDFAAQMMKYSRMYSFLDNAGN